MEAGGCASSKDDNAQARLERLHQLVAAADEYEPGDIMGVAAWESDSEADAMLPPVDAAEPGGGRTGGAGDQGEQQRAGGGGGGAAAAAAGQRQHNVAVARNFLDEVALYSGVEEGAGTRGVRLMTMHASKGLEFEAVFVAGGRAARQGAQQTQQAGRAAVPGRSRASGVHGKECPTAAWAGVIPACARTLLHAHQPRTRLCNARAAVPRLPPTPAGCHTGCSEGRMPLVRGDEHNYHELVQEERRLFFVSLTRAKQKLTMLAPLESMWGQGGRCALAVPGRALANEMK